jgi:hypothetical protein
MSGIVGLGEGETGALGIGADIGAGDAMLALDSPIALGGGTDAGTPLGGGTLAGGVSGCDAGVKSCGSGGGSGIDEMRGACGLRGAIPDALRCASGICGGDGATGDEGVWGRGSGFFGLAIRTLGGRSAYAGRDGRLLQGRGETKRRRRSE